MPKDYKIFWRRSSGFKVGWRLIACSKTNCFRCNVDDEKGLVGYCDYILSRSKEQLTINALVILITEAKNENIKAGLGQCIAGMFAAQYFNQREGQPIDAIYGAVTTGEIWKFLKLTDTTVSIDLTDYYISPNLSKILGILIQGLDLPVLAV